MLPRPIVPELDAIVLSVWKYASFWFRLNFLRFKYIQLEPTWYFDHFCSEITSKSLKIYIVCTFFNKTFKWSEVLKSKSAIPFSQSDNSLKTADQWESEFESRNYANFPTLGWTIDSNDLMMIMEAH